VAVTTIRDVAREAGVSTALVSFYLNGTQPVGAESRERIRAAIEKLGYTPNGAARSLRSKRTGILGIMVPYLTNPTFAIMAASAEEVFAQHGYLAITCSTGRDPERRRTYFTALHVSRIEGLLVFPSAEAVEEIVALARRHVPVVLLEREVDFPAAAPSVDAVLMDNELGIYLATDHLLGLGHRRIGLITLPLRSPSGPPRVRGYRRAYAEHGLVAPDDLVAADQGSVEAGYAQCRRLLALRPPPTALVIASNMQTLGALQAIQEAGLRIPGDLSIVGYSHPGFPIWSGVPMTVVHYPVDELGRLAAELLLRRLRDRRQGARQRVILQPELEVHASTAPPAFVAAG
jgi:DNA-binding LacI/PurR family transcriptional regulator